MRTCCFHGRFLRSPPEMKQTRANENMEKTKFRTLCGINQRDTTRAVTREARRHGSRVIWRCPARFTRKDSPPPRRSVRSRSHSSWRRSNRAAFHPGRCQAASAPPPAGSRRRKPARCRALRHNRDRGSLCGAEPATSFAALLAVAGPPLLGLPLLEKAARWTRGSSLSLAPSPPLCPTAANLAIREI